MARKSSTKAPTFEQRLAELEDIVRMLDAEDLPLEEAIKHYETGVKLSGALNQTLDSIQRKIEVLTQTEDGELTTVPFEEGEDFDA